MGLFVAGVPSSYPSPRFSPAFSLPFPFPVTLAMQATKFLLGGLNSCGHTVRKFEVLDILVEHSLELSVQHTFLNK